MQIVVPSQQTLQEILGQLSPQAEPPLALNGHGNAYPEHINGDSLQIEVSDYVSPGMIGLRLRRRDFH